MLGWNAFLAFIPLVFVYLYDRNQKNKHLKWLLFLIWLFFYPNSLYLITDLIYLNQDTFMEDQGMYQGLLYLKDFKVYLGFFHIFLAAMYGVMTALISFDYFYKKINKSTFKMYFFIGVPILVSIAIYLGRFLRFNSWDLLNPFRIISGFINDISVFTFLYILLFTLIQYILFGGYILKEKKFL
ncbi:MAG: DUF1361 domain-containing protein [Candidatus Izemoplasmatales bacterium]